ncbi:hypothetical protein PVAND_007011 [Polypedilum vanderplanki]|uniref:C2H2-type domain-containing protein n=1 Tax=Polypedilum vanderplanki TaxID=319348 RepID=A0A9J6C5Q8_POLVA|nr:hypothetical protein PVAND_007011 [Polypedilum vanderplanki]
MARRKTKTNVKKTTTNVSTTAAATKMTSNSMIKDPGGKEEQHIHLNNKIIINNRTNGVNVSSSSLKATKDQLITSSTLPSNIQQSNNNNNISSTTITTNSTSGLINNNNTTNTTDSKYLHKKFKKFCATVDSNQTNINSNNFNHTTNISSSHNSDRSLTSSENTITTNNSAIATVVTNNNNIEIVENKTSSWISTQSQDTTSLTNHHHQFQSLVPSSLSSPKHFQTTEEEKQLVKDIIDINNENFMQQSANHSLNLQNSSSFLIANTSSGGPLVTVTTLGNHNSNYNQTGDIRQKVIASQEPTTVTYNSSNQTPNGNFVIINNQLSSVDFSQQQQSTIASGLQQTTPSINSTAGPGRYICPYCQLNCAKPSVLQKHIRAHTNERPYPCTPCGFAFKTKSNLYKHCRSRAHIQRCNGEADLNTALISQQNEEDGCSLESGDIDAEAESSNQIETMNRLSSPSIVMESQINGNFGENSSSSSSNSSSHAFPNNNSSSDTSKPYKPKFHNYKKLDLSKASALVMPPSTPISTATTTTNSLSTPSTPSTPSLFFSANAGNLTPQIIEERISRIISDNEAIIDNVEALLQKKYHKITGIQRNLSTSSGGSVTSFSTTNTTAPSTAAETSPQSNSKLALALLKQQQQQKQHDEEILRYQMTSAQPLNLIKMQEPLSVDVGTSVNVQPHRKRFLSENMAPLVITSQQPETTICSSAEKLQQQPPAQLVIPTSHPQNPEGSIIKDLLLNSKNFGAVDGEGDGTYTCPTCKISFRGADILKYHLICHCGDENILSRSAPMSPSSSTSSPFYKNSPSSLISLAQSQLRANVQSSRTPSSLQKLARSQLKVPKPKPENIVISPTISAISVKPTIIVNNQSMIKNPLPSPGPLLGNTRLVDKKTEEEFASSSKKQKLDFTSTTEKKVSPFFDMKFMHDKTTASKNFPSGGSFIESKVEDSQEISPSHMMRQGLSGGTALEVPIKKESPCEPPPITPKLIVTITPTLAPTLTTNSILQSTSKNHFQFPQVTAYNPLTLSLLSTSQQQQTCGPQSIIHGSRVIPYVPGIPGPNTLNIVNKNDLPPPPVPTIKDKRLNSPLIKQNGIIAPPREISPMPRPNGIISKKKPFNFARIADSIDTTRVGRKSPELNMDIQEEISQEQQKPSKPSFLRPTSLPLKPGTFTPKQHHGITPTANTLPLISPETPRPSKSCVQLYLNGHAYTYLGLKSSTKPFYCTVNKPQPTYIQNQHKLSMYSNWQIYNGNNPNILDLSPYAAMSLYDSRQRPNKFSIADEKKNPVKLIDMQTIRVTVAIAPTNYQIQQVTIKDEQSLGSNNMAVSSTNPHPPNVIGFESNEEYTYIRGRGRGKYICQECGIRCKKPSMLKKHIRTHTDLRPYTCSYCEFSFKTKGNLTKHMKSKAHFKKCSELGLNPIPTDDDLNDIDENGKRSMSNGRDNDGSRCDSETETDEDMDDESDDDTDESKSRMPEHEAAQLLLSLSNHATSGTRPSSTNPIQQLEQQQVIQLPQNFENWQERTTPTAAATESIPRSRIIFSNTKTDFDLLNHGKYYSNPAISRPKDMPIAREVPTTVVETNDEEDDAMPIDLTKKPQSKSEVNQLQSSQQRPVIVHVSDVITKISDPAVLLNQLVSNTDKLPTNSIGQVNSSINFTDAVQYTESFLPQEYITERALKDARIKQIQQAGKIDYSSVIAIKDRETLNDETQVLVSKSVANAPQQNKNSNNGMMEALAELASKSDKLEIKNDESKPSTVNNAKNVASEYLKLTKQKLTQKIIEDSGENNSDQEAQVKLLTPQTIVVGEDGFHKKAPSSNLYNNDPLLYSQLQDDSGRPVCVVCSKVFQKASQLKIHMNIHYMERKFRCEACGVSFRTQGHLQKHERSVGHQNKVNMSSTFGVPSVSNPRPFKCKDCKIAFRIHGHLAKHLRSKMHVLKLECLQKLPFGTYAEMERSGFNLTDIDTSDCDNSLMSLRSLAKKLNEKDPSKLGPLPPLSIDDSIDGDESGMNENYDSDSSDTGIINNHINDDDLGNNFKRKIDDSDTEIMKKIKLTTMATIESSESLPVPSNNSAMDDEKTHLTCAKN